MEFERDPRHDTDVRKLTWALYRTSKLSQDELNQLQKDTHFDKKELQQWYKGESMAILIIQVSH